ncbi:MAG: ABC transporter substrate-binding protein [Gammaproteobacteria bacterium]
MTDGTRKSRSAAASGVHERTPHRIGQILDWGIGVPPLKDQLDATQMAFDEAFESGLLDRPVEVITHEIEGLPYENFGVVRRAYLDLVARDCIGIIGPHITEQAIAIKSVVDEVEVPTLAMCGTLRFHGPWHFLLPNGTFCDESALMVEVLSGKGVKSVGVLREDNSLGIEYFEFFRRAARERGIAIASEHQLGTYMSLDDARRAVQRCRADGAQALAYMGFGPSARHVFLAVEEAAATGWTVPRVTTSIFMGSIPDLGYGFQPSFYEGWIGVDQFDERNTVLQAVYDRFETRFKRRPPLHCYLAIGFDMGNVMARALSMAHPATPDGLREALERVRMLPAAIGGPGTVISFAPYDHRGYKGDYIVMRTMEGGVNRRA